MAREQQVTDWPELPLSAWADTCATLHLWTQMVGKVRLAHAPLINHWWQVPLYVTSRGLTTSPIPYAARSFQIDFDFIGHRLEIRCNDGGIATIPLVARSVADFYAEIMGRLRELGLETRIWTMPVEIPDAIPFEQDRDHAAYDPDYAHRFWRSPGACRPSLHPLPVAVPRQGQSGPFLLGQFRSGGHALLRPQGGAADQRVTQCWGMGDAGGLLARGEQLRVLAGEWGFR